MKPYLVWVRQAGVSIEYICRFCKLGVGTYYDLMRGGCTTDPLQDKLIKLLALAHGGTPEVMAHIIKVKEYT